MRTASARSGLTARYLLLAAAAAVCALPFFWMVSSAFKTPADMARFPPTWLPSHPTLANFTAALETGNYGRQLLNSLVYAGGSTVANLVLCSLAGYAFARMTFPGQRWIFGLVIALIMVPAQSQLIPVFVILKHIPLAGGNDLLGDGGTGLLNTYAGLVMPTAATPFGILLMRQFFRGLPRDYEEAARIDGAGTWTVFSRIILPLSRPAMAALGIITFQTAWNDFVWPLILTNDSSMTNLQLGLQLFQSSHDAQQQILMAAGVLNILPMIVVFLIGQRYFVGGLNVSGLKG
ncbi:carbohydrate ABC transporter permease [Streptomyces sp. NBC_00988]|uniref:carbohydrate ABC transporter permease n=1 Tax=Streptomyces sp. NBC_00988 TaxID=2903704 RepID=UPI0038655A0E|nr:carbohydrate ABC transporter permease [Streptomyces sp. NBC_00988]